MSSNNPKHIDSIDDDKLKHLSTLFKKPFNVSSKTPLKSNVARTIKTQLLARFPQLQSVEALESIIPLNNKSQPLICAKLSNKTLLYYIDASEPLIFDATNGKGELWPTLYLCWKLLNNSELNGGIAIAKPIYVYPGVSRFVLHGSDLMLPGIVHDEGQQVFHGHWRVGQPRLIYTRGNPTPFAIGQLRVDAQYVAEHGWSGKAVTILHHFNDLLYQLGHCNAPNDGFHAGKLGGTAEVVALPQPLDKQVQEWSEHLSDDELKQGDGENGVASATSLSAQTMLYDTESSAAQTSPAAVDDDVDEAQIAVESLAVTENVSANVNGSDKIGDSSNGTEVNATLEESDLSAEADDDDNSTPARKTPYEPSKDDMDEALRAALEYAIITSRIEPSILPLPAFQILPDYLEPSNPLRFALDFKHSSYKKLAKWLKAMSNEGLLTYRERQDGLVLTTVSPQHPSVLSRVIDKKYTDAVKAKEKEKLKGQRAAARAQNPDFHDGPPAPRVVRVHIKYRASKSLHTSVPPFSAADKSKLYTIAEARELLFKYIEDMKLEVERSGRDVKLDEALRFSLFPGSSTSMTTVTKAELVKRLTAAMQPQIYHYIAVNDEHELSELPDTAFTRGPPPSIQIVVETRSGNKSITKLLNVELWGIDEESISGEMRKEFAGSSSVVDNTVGGGGSKKAVIVQGNVASRVAEWLEKRWHVPKQYVEYKESGGAGVKGKKGGGK